MAAEGRGFRRFLQFRVSTLLGLVTGICPGFAPLKLWELWRDRRSPSATMALSCAAPMRRTPKDVALPFPLPGAK